MARVIVIVGGGDGRPVSRSDAGAVTLAAQRLGGPFDAVSLSEAARDDAALRLAAASGALTARWVSRAEDLVFDVALVGSGGAGAMGDLLPAKLAKQRGAALVLDVLDVESAAVGLRVTRDLGRGAREVVMVTGPAVLAISEDVRRGRYVSRYRREHASVGALRGEREVHAGAKWEPARPRAKTAGIAKKTGGSATDRMHAAFGVVESAPEAAINIVAGDAELCAKHLLRFLSHHGLIRRKIAGPGAAPVARGAHADRASGAAKNANSGSDGATAAVLRGPRPINGPARGIERRPRSAASPSGLPGDAKLARGPRKMDGVTPGLARRPRPLLTPAPSAGQAVIPALAKLARGPRSLSQPTRTKIRGPFTC